MGESIIVHTGDCFDVLEEIEAESVHAVVTDPPYGLNFMGKDWDNFRRKRNDADSGRENVFGRTSSTSPAHGAETEGKRYQEWCEEWARAVKRVLKPGGHLLAFSGNRTHHRLFSGVEDAGYEIRDTITWHYAEGFPKALDVSKALDKQADAEREVVGMKPGYSAGRDPSNTSGGWDRPWKSEDDAAEHKYEKTAPATDAAAEWGGFKTALKPATEFVVLARKPLSEGTVAENVLEHGTGALNIDGTRINSDSEFSWQKTDIPERTNRPERDGREEPDGNAMARHESGEAETVEPDGRYPSNVVFDAAEAERLDEQVGGSGGGPSRYFKTHEWDAFAVQANAKARFKYTPKASQSERTMSGQIDNDHPTVKPLDLMEWLITLATAEGQTVLDPFCGSGTTLRAAKDCGRGAIGIERQPEYADLARARAGLTPETPARFVDDDATTLGAYTDGPGGDE